MIETPQYLKEQDIIDFKKDTCIFCNGKFPVLCRHASGVAESRGDHGFGGSEYSWSSQTYYPKDLDLILFTFSFADEQKRKIMEEGKFRARLSSQVEARAKKLRQDLEERLGDLPPQTRTRAINAAIIDISAEAYPQNIGATKSRYFHNLFFGDIGLIFTRKSYYAPQGSWDDKVYYEPNAIKVHLDCWPYEKAKQEEKGITRTHPTILKALEKNPRFEGYRAVLDQPPEIHALARNIKAEIKFKRYNPLELRL